MMRTTLQIAALIAATGLTGCGSKTVTMREWQKEVERFTAADGAHNLTALRQSRSDEGCRQFAVLGTADRRKSTDVVGVLVGLAPSERLPWYVFVVGTVDSCAIKETRVIAVSEAAGELRWIVGPSQPQATAAYIQRHGSGEAANPFLRFPAESAAFELECNDREAVVVERNSGARWTVKIDAATTNTIVATDQ